MERSSTDQNLSTIINRNSTRRRSLIYSNDYKNSSSDDESTENKEADVQESLLEKEAVSADLEEIKSIIHTIELTYKTNRLKRGKSSNPDNQVENYRSQFGDILFLETSTTIFDADYFKKSQMYGIYILFWLGTAFLMMNNIVHYWIENKTPFYQLPIVKILRQDLFKVALTDLAMYLSTYFAFFVQYLCLKKIVRWKRTGWLIQGTYDLLFLGFWLTVGSKHVFAFPWIARVFLLLHSLVFLMKMRSYSFYNGYLWNITEELEFSQKYLERCTPDNEKLKGAKNIESYKETLINSVKFCKFELAYQGSNNFQSSDPNVLQDPATIAFPQNITLKNFFQFTMFPTVVYTLNFPRTKRIRWGYVFEKIAAIFGIFFLMIIVAQNGMYLLVEKAHASRTLPLNERAQQYCLVLLDIIPYFLLQYLFTFFIIWEFILNVIAELSRFADRDFYGPWWSCTDWGEFARIWNRPVHKFLLRHVYHSSISTIKLNKVQASLFTFMLSALIHELVMFSIFRVLRGYLLLFQMSQLPMMFISNTKFFRDKKTLGNVVCWIGFISGPSIICTLYLFF